MKLQFGSNAIPVVLDIDLDFDEVWEEIEDLPVLEGIMADQYLVMEDDNGRLIHIAHSSDATDGWAAICGDVEKTGLTLDDIQSIAQSFYAGNLPDWAGDASVNYFPDGIDDILSWGDDDE